MLQHQAQHEHKLGANSSFLQADRSSLMEFCSWQRGSQPDPLIFPALNEFEICVIEKGKKNQTLESKRRGLHSHPDSENCLRTHFTPKLAFPLLLCFRGIQALIQGGKNPVQIWSGAGRKIAFLLQNPPSSCPEQEGSSTASADAPFP